MNEMNDEKRFSLNEVRAAFQTLEDHVAKQGADAGCVWSIHWAAEDVLSILAGDWSEPAGQVVAADADEELVL